MLVYRTYSLDARNDEITRALIMVHGGARNGDDYFRHSLAAGFLAGRLEDTIVIAPRFASNNGDACSDILAEGELNWQCGPHSWRDGGAANDNGNVTSFDVADEILRKLARKEIFPNLSAIVVAGHSAGGQFVTRYEMTNQVHELLGVSISYVVANPGFYTYLDSLRPSATAFPPNVAAVAPGYVAPVSGNSSPPFASFSDARNCTTYNSWPYGLQNRSGYSAKLTEEQLKEQLAARPTSYLLGAVDVRRGDRSCSATAQGPTRLARGLAFARYVNERHGAQHETLVVRGCGHNARCMFTADPALPLLFPRD